MGTLVDYIPVILNAIRVDTTVGCDLYLQNSIKTSVTYVLYCSGKSIIRSHKIEDLQKHKINTLFIRKEDQKIYLKYVESNLKYIVNDNRVDIKEKAAIVYDVAKDIMVDVFEDPRSGEHVERSKNWVSNTVEFVMRNKGAFSSMINMISYDYYTYTHSVNVSVLGLLFAKYLGFLNDEMQVLGSGLLLHDVGKTKINPEIINKKGKLDEEEKKQIQMHVELGADILIQIGGIDRESYFPIMQHHEKDNGKGYPKGLHGDGIHKYGKIAGIIDVYDALTTRRSYSDARKPYHALTMMKDEMSGSFDKIFFNEFIMFLGSGGEKEYQKKKFPVSEKFTTGTSVV